MATDRQDHYLPGNIQVWIDKAGNMRAHWLDRDGGDKGLALPPGADVDASQVLAAIIGSDAGMSEAVQTLAPGAIVKLSFASARNGDANALTRDRLCHAPGCFISVDVATDLIDGRDGLSNITFWIDGEMAKAITSSSRMQQQTQQARERRHAFPGRL